MIKYYFSCRSNNVIYAKAELIESGPLHKKLKIINGFGHMNFSEPGTIVYPNSVTIYNSQYQIIDNVFRYVNWRFE